MRIACSQGRLLRTTRRPPARQTMTAIGSMAMALRNSMSWNGP